MSLLLIVVPQVKDKSCAVISIQLWEQPGSSYRRTASRWLQKSNDDRSEEQMKNESQTASWAPLRGASCLWERMCEQRILPSQEPKTTVLCLFHSLLSCFGCYDFSEAIHCLPYCISQNVDISVHTYSSASIFITWPQCQPLPKLQPSVLMPHTHRQSHLPCLIASLTGTSGAVATSLLRFVVV